MGQFPVLFIDDLRRISGSRLVYSGRRPVLGGVTTDSRAVKAGDMFVALKGERFDGHDFLPQVVAARAGGVLITHEGFVKHREVLKNTFTVIVEDPEKALGVWGQLHRRRHEIPVIAVAGSNGKTGTKDLLAHVLAGMGPVCATRGNLNNQIGVPLTLLRLEPRHRLAVIEIGTNHFGEVARLCEWVEPTHGVITSIGHEHLEFFKTLAGVEKAEFELADHLMTTGGMLFAPLHDPRIAARLARMVPHWPAKKLFPFQLGGLDGKKGGPGREPHGLKPRHRSTLYGLDPRLCPLMGIPRSGSRTNPIRCRATGLPGAWAVAAASAVADALGMKPEAIRRRLGLYKPPANKRMEWSSHRGVTILNDAYNANLDSMVMGLHTIARMDIPGRKIAVLGDMLELGAGAVGAHRTVGRLAKKLHMDVFAFGPLSKGLAAAAGVRDRHYVDIVKLSADVKASLRKGDLLYLKGSRGMKLERVLEHLTGGKGR